MGKMRQVRLGRIAVLMVAMAALWSGRSFLAQQADESDQGNPKDKPFKALKWRLIGPFRGGRVLAVTGVSGEPNTYYFGAVAGGVWKTTNGGVSWEPIFDKQPIASIGAIAVAPSDPNVIYVGTGEACIRGDISYGDGVYKSTDAGKTWSNVGLKDTLHIGRIAVHPTNPDLVFVAALGHAYGPNSGRGVFRSADGGKTWQKVLYKDDKTGAIDITFAPSNPHIMFAALWEANRTPWGLTSGGPGSGLYKSTDDGVTWKHLEGNGLPKGVMGRIGVAVAGGDPNRVYAQIEAEHGGLYVSNDGGEHWSMVNGDHRFTQRAWYFTHVFADPKNVDTVYELNTGTNRSIDGGHTFKPLRTPHGDCHGFWIDPANPDRMIEGNDGGATISTDGGQTWTTLDNQPTAQFYHVATDNRFRYYVYGAQQDNSTVAIASSSDNGAIGPKDWYDVGGGESGFVLPYPPDPNIVYAGSYDGLITRYNHENGQEQDINPWPDNPMGSGAADLKYRFQWTAPIALSPHDPNTLYFGANVLFKSTDGGASWTIISPDLTRNDKSKQQSAGGPITKDNTSVEYYDTIFAIAESPVEKNLIWAGSDDGLIHLTRDGGQHWDNVTPKDLPEWSMISLIDPSPHAAGSAYVAVDRHKLDDRQPYIYKTSDYGKTWSKITNGIADYVHAVREDPKHKGLLFAGTETGVWVSWDDGGHWRSLQLDLPVSPVHDLTVHGDDLIVATHGRAFWILDDIEPIRQFSDQIESSDAYLYKPALAYRQRGGGFFRPRGAIGANPPSGAVIDYYLKSGVDETAKGEGKEKGADQSGSGDKAKSASRDDKEKKGQEVTLEILDSKGKVVRKLSSKPKAPEGGGLAELAAEFGFELPGEQLPAKAGLNRFVWDLHYQKPTDIHAIGWGGFPEGALALPGTYQVRLSAFGKTLTEPFEVKLDPRIKTSPADLEKQFELMTRINEKVSADHDAVKQIRDLRAELADLRKRLGDDPGAKPIVEATKAIDKKITEIEEALIQTKTKSGEDALNYPIKLNDKLMGLGGTVQSADTAPTRQSYEVLDDLSRQLDEPLAKWREVMSKDVPALNESMHKAKLGAVLILAVKHEEE
ncbi:MAG TPA: glycosyl hydrolase [Terriglobia bacterium]|nr:glycosyl hydrolase [Terriglobia bacterium]